MNYSKVIQKNIKKKIYIENIKSNNSVVNINNDYENKDECNTISNWESKNSYNIIKLYEIVSYEYNVLLKNCNINKFKEFVILFSNIYDPYSLKLDSDDSDEEIINEDDYMSN